MFLHICYNIIEGVVGVGRKEKLIKKLNNNPKDFTFKESYTLLKLLGIDMSNKGRTSGSRVKFMKNNIPIILHKPHPRKELLEYQIRQIVDTLEKEDLI